jgi:hypothetical protein
LCRTFNWRESILFHIYELLCLDVTILILILKYFPRLLMKILAAKRTFCTAWDIPSSGPAVRYFKMPIVLWRYKSSVVIGNLVITPLCVSFTNTFYFQGYRNGFSSAEVFLVWKVVSDGRKLSGSTTLWCLFGFYHLEKNMKSRLVLCVIVIKYLLDNVFVKSHKAGIHRSEEFTGHN